MGWPQILMMVLLAMDVGMNLAKHGETREGKYNFGVTLIADGIIAALLWAGGFFS